VAITVAPEREADRAKREESKMQNPYLMATSGGAVPGTPLQELAALLHEARILLRTACLGQMAASQPAGTRRHWLPVPVQVTPVLTHDEEFLEAGEDAVEAADKLCRYANDCAGAIKELVGYFGKTENLEPREADWLCEFITDLCCKADRALQDIHRQAAALQMAKQAACDNIELRYVCPPDPCAVGEGPGQFTPRELSAAEVEAREAQAREAQAREARAREEQAREAQAREEQAREAQAREAQAREAQAREARAREAQAREEQAREAQAREAQAREAQAREAAAEERAPETESTRRRRGRRGERSPG
jgi:hypothetical protein